MLKSRVIFALLLIAATTVAVPTGPAVAQYGHWHRSPFQFSRHYAQFRQESPWRRWGPGRQTSYQSMKQSRWHGEMVHAPSSIGAYNPGNTPGPRFMSASSSRPNAGYPLQNGGGYRNAGSSYQGAGYSYQGAGSAPQGAGSSSQGVASSSRSTDSSSAAGNQLSETRYICIVAGMGYCGFNGRANISSGSRCYCGENSGVTR
jgi:hypothetical protein